MAKTNYQTIDEYHQTFNGEALERMQTIRKMIHQAVPDAEEAISYQIPCFKYHGYLLYYATFPKHVSISHPYSDAFWAAFRQELEGYKTSKSVIQFPSDKPLPKQLIKRIIAFRKKENEEQAKHKKTTK